MDNILNTLGLGVSTADAPNTEAVAETASTPAPAELSGLAEADEEVCCAPIEVSASMFDFTNLSDVDPELAARVNGAANRGRDVILAIMKGAQAAGKGALRMAEIEVAYTRFCKSTGEKPVGTVTIRAYLAKLIEAGLVRKPSEMTYIIA